MTAWSNPAHEAAVQRPRRLRRTWPQRIFISVGVVATVSMFAAACTLAWGLQRYRAINFLSVPGVEQAEPGQPANWLLVGSDSREGIDPNDPNAGIFLGEEVSGKRTDTIMVARVDPEVQTIDLLSVPRDLWVPIAGTGENGRVNAAFNGDGGEQRLVSTVEDALGIEINHYAEINFVGFQAIIDALGGVPIWFDNPVRDPASALDVSTPGCHTLDGFDALAFARSRHLEYQVDGVWQTDPTGDLGRTARQQYLLSRLANTARDQVGVSDLGTVDRILQVGGQNLVLDDGASAGSLVGLARTFSAVGSDGIRRHALPVEGFRTSGGAAVLDLQREAAQPVLELFRGARPVDPTAAPSEEEVPRVSFTLDVQNGARLPGLAGDTADELRALGFTPGEVTDAPASVEQSTILYPSGAEAAAATLGRALPGPALYTRDDTVGRVTLVVGPDRAGFADAAAVADPATTTPPEAVPDTTVAVVGENVVGVVPGPAPEGTPCE